MPLIHISLASQRGKPVDDNVDTFILEGPRGNVLRDLRDVESSGRSFTVDAAPGDYQIQLEIEAFQIFRGRFNVPAVPRRSTPLDMPITLQHRCTRLPSFDELSPEQQAWLRSYAPRTEPRATWDALTDNQCCTFFQLSYALLNTSLPGGRTVASYVEAIAEIGGARIVNTIADGKKKTATGWRMHVYIREQDKKQLEKDLIVNDAFKKDSGKAIGTHSMFGFKHSYRQTGPLPRLQIVLNDARTMADTDLDVELHRSSPHDVYPHLRTKFPAVATMYTVV